MAAERLPPLSRDATVLAFGDSLTFGVGGSGQDYPSRLSQSIHRRVVNAGEPGETTAGGRTRLARELRSTSPQLLILCLGVNDFLQGVPDESIRSNLLAMLEMAHSAKVPVLLLAVPRPGTSSPDAVFTSIAMTAGVVVDDQSMVETLSNPALKAGLIHPNSEGYREVADHIVERLKADGALPGSRWGSP